MKTIEQLVAISSESMSVGHGVCCAAFVKRLRNLGWTRGDVDKVKLQAIRMMSARFDECSAHLAYNFTQILSFEDEMEDERFREMVQAEIFAEFAVLGCKVADAFHTEKGGR